jgi:peptidoglycan/LPS O-acetylase OafA/YrhL
MNRPAPSHESRLQGLDALRGLAALAVVLYHYTYRYASVIHPGLKWAGINGHLGVNLFFIISGFVIFLSLERSKNAQDFAVSRFARLWPAYVVCACFTLSVITFASFNPFGLTFRDAILNLPMMNKALGNVSIDPSYWTLTYELLFYATAAVAFFYLRIRRIEWACMAWMAVAFVMRITGFNDRHQRIGVFLGVDFCHLFILGMMIYLLWKRRHTWLTLVTAVWAFAMNLFGPYYNPGHVALWQFVGVTALFALTVWLAAESRLKFLTIWPLVFLGEISYSLYLVHQVAGYWLINRLMHLGWDSNIAVALTILAAIAIATCVRHIVEIPAQKRIRRIYKNAIQPAPVEVSVA